MPVAPTAAVPLARFGGRLAGIGALGALTPGEMPRGDMNLHGIALPAGLGASDGSPLDEALPETGDAMPTGAMDDQPRGGETPVAMDADDGAQMPAGAMTNGTGEMPAAGALRRREDPDAGGELAADPADGEAGAGGMPTADMRHVPAAYGASDESDAVPALAIGGEWRLTLSSMSVGRRA